MVKVDNEAKARESFQRLFKRVEDLGPQLLDRRESEGPNETELEMAAFEAASRDAARTLTAVQGRLIRVLKRDVQAPPTKKRTKGWLYREMREVRG